MVALSPKRRQTVRDCLFPLLHDLLDESIGELRIKTLQSRYECAASVVSALIDVVNSVISDFSEEWNAANSDPLSSLPTELARKCFAQLDFRGRIAVSHVSRGWRRIALADATLWNEYALGYTTRGRKSVLLDAVTTLLARSRPLPFQFSGFPPCYDVPDFLVDFIAQNMHTMGALLMGDEFLRLAHLDAPALTHFTWQRDSWADAPELPKDWVAKHAPNLEFLDLRTVRFPADLLPCPALRTLRAYVPSNTALHTPFFELFPKLTWLELIGITQDFLSILLQLPPTVDTILLTGAFACTVDYSQFLQNLEPSRIREMNISGTVKCRNALELFIQAPSDRRTLDLRKHSLRLHDAQRDWTIACYTAITDKLQYLHRFTTLELPLSDAWRLHETTRGWDRQLPTLRSLSLSLIESSDHLRAQRLIDNCRKTGISPVAGIHMPVLESLTLSSRWGGDAVNVMDLLSAIASILLPPLLSNTILPLASIIIQQDYLDSLSRADVAHFFPLAERVVVGNEYLPDTPSREFTAELEPADIDGTNVAI